MLLKDKNGPPATLIMDCLGATPVIVAVESRRKGVVDLLLACEQTRAEQMRAVRASDSATLMHIAAKRLDLQTLSILKECSDMSKAVDVDGETPLHWAFRVSEKDALNRSIEEKRGRVLDMLLAYGADLKTKTTSGVTAVHLAAETGSEVGLATLLKAAGEHWPRLLHVETRDGFTPLMKAAQKNHPGTMELILSRRWNSKRNATSFVHSGGWTEANLMHALVVAAEAGHTNILTEFGPRVQPKAFANYKWAPSLLLAAESNNVDTVKFLMEKEIMPQLQVAESHPLRDRYGDATALFIAAQRGNHEIVNLLLEQADMLMTKEDIVVWYTMRHNQKGPTALLAAIHSHELNEQNALLTVGYLLSFANMFEINIHVMNGGGVDPWFVISHFGVEMELDDPSNAGGGRKHLLPHGEEVGVVEVLEGTQVRVEFPVAGWIILDSKSPQIAQEETPLHAAVQSQSLDLVRKILSHYQDNEKALEFALEQPDRMSFTPLLLAANRHLPDVVELLLESGADPHARSTQHETLLHIFARWSGLHPEVLPVLQGFAERLYATRHKKRKLLYTAPTCVMQSMTPEKGTTVHSRSPSMLEAAVSVSTLRSTGTSPTSSESGTDYSSSSEGSAVPHVVGTGLVEVLLLRTRPVNNGTAAATALETACRHGATTVVEWILKQHATARHLLNPDQHEQVDTDCRQGFEFAADKLPLHKPVHIGAKTTTFKLKDIELNCTAIVHLMFQFSIPIPVSILRRTTADTSRVHEYVIDDGWLDPLENLFLLVFKLHGPYLASSVTSGGAPVNITITSISPRGGTTTKSAVKEHKARLSLPLHQQWLISEAGEPFCCTVGSHEVLLALGRALEKVAAGSWAPNTHGLAGKPAAASNVWGKLPFDSVEIVHTKQHVVLEKEGVRVRVDFIHAQSGVYIQMQRLKQLESHDLRVRIQSKKVAKVGYLLHNEAAEGGLKLENSAIVWYAYLYVNELEYFDLEAWVTRLVDDDGIEYNLDSGWAALSTAQDVKGTELEPIISQVHPLGAIMKDPIACDKYDHFFSKLATSFKRGCFTLFQDAQLVEDRDPSRMSRKTSSLLAGTLVTYLWYRVLQRGNPLQQLDITGVVLDEEHEALMEKWISIRNGVLSHLSLLRFSSRQFGLIEVTPKLGDEVTEVRPLASLLAGNFAMDLKFITCTSKDTSPRVIFDPVHETYVFFRDAREVFDKEDTENQKKAEKSLAELIAHDDLQRVTGIPLEKIKECRVRWACLEDVCTGTEDDFTALNVTESTARSAMQAVCRKEIDRIKAEYPAFSSESYSKYFGHENRQEVLLRLMTGKRQKIDQVNEALDLLSTQGRGIQIDLRKFHEATTTFGYDQAKGLLEYMRRHRAVKALRFRNLNFVEKYEENQPTVLREFIQSKLLRGLTCRNIDFGEDNKHVGEVFLTVATFNPGDEDTDYLRNGRDEAWDRPSEGIPGSTQRTRDWLRNANGATNTLTSNNANNHVTEPTTFLPRQQTFQVHDFASETTVVMSSYSHQHRRRRRSTSRNELELDPHNIEGGLTPLKYFQLEGVTFLVSPMLRKYPLHYLIKLVHERREEVAGTSSSSDPGSFHNFAPSRRGSIFPSELHMKDSAAGKTQREQYANILSLTKKTILFLNSRDPCFFLKWAKRKCDKVTPLRLAIHLRLDDIVECMIGLQKTQGGLLKRTLAYEPERLEMDHFVDLWGCLERDPEDLLPLHAAMIQVGVNDHDDNVAPGGKWQVYTETGEQVTVARHKRPYHIRNYKHRLDDKPAPSFLMNPLFDQSLGLAELSPPTGDSEGLEHIIFRHPKHLQAFMAEITLLTERAKLISYVDTAVDTDTSHLGDNVNRSIKIARQLISCSFVERSITVAGNPPPRGCKQWLEIPHVIDGPDSSEFDNDRTKTQKLLLSRTWDRTGVNEPALHENTATTLLIALKFAPYVVPHLLKWSDLIELDPRHKIRPTWLGLIHLQDRRGFRSVCIPNEEPMLGHISWCEEEDGLNLAHWACVRDQKRLLERVIAEDAECVFDRTSRLERTALHYACYAGSLECLNVLLLHYSDKSEHTSGIHCLDREGNTPLHISASLCHPICTEALLDAGARPYWKNRKSSGGLDPHDCTIALLLHHTHKEQEFYKENLTREWERDAGILRSQISLLNQDHRIQRKLSLQAAKSFLFEASFYFVFLAVLCLVVRHRTTLFQSDAYFRTAGVRSEIMQEPVNYEDSPFFKTLEDTGSIDDIFDFLRGPFVGQLFPTSGLNASWNTPKDDSDGILFGLLHLVGTVRLRQIRVRNDTCSRPAWVNNYFPGCFGGYTPSNEEVGEPGDSYMNSRWVDEDSDPAFYGWRSQMEMWYPNHGFAEELYPNETADAFTTLMQMEEDGWIDLQTRAVFAEFTLYNPNAHNFLVGKILFEIPEYGGVHASYRLTNIKLITCIPGGTSQLTCQHTYDVFIFVLESCLLISVVFLSYDELSDMWNSWVYVKQMSEDEDKRRLKESKEKEAAGKRSTTVHRTVLTPSVKHGMFIDDMPISKKMFNFTAYLWHGVAHYFWRDWNLVDLCSVVMFWLVVGTRFAFVQEILKVDSEEVVTDHSRYFDLWPIAALTRAERELWALVMVLYFVKVLKYVMILPKLGSVATAITTTIGDSKVLIFFVVFMVIAIALMLGLHLLLGDSALGYRSFGITLVSFMQIVFGQWEYSAFSQESWLIGPFLFLLTLFLANLVLINVFIAVVGNIYEENLRKSVERWSWQIIDEYQYKLTGIPRPRGTGNPVMTALGCIYSCLKGICKHGEVQMQPAGDVHNFEEFPMRVMRKEAVQRLMKSQQRIQTNLAQVNENVDTVKHSVQNNAATLDRLHEQLDKLDSSIHHVQSAQDELRRMFLKQQKVP
ncbi:Polycystin-2 [Diplonema papillatum]|nr:Polycystin-2 [Diplonema papillatum]